MTMKNMIQGSDKVAGNKDDEFILCRDDALELFKITYISEIFNDLSQCFSLQEESAPKQYNKEENCEEEITLKRTKSKEGLESNLDQRTEKDSIENAENRVSSCVKNTHFQKKNLNSPFKSPVTETAANLRQNNNAKRTSIENRFSEKDMIINSGDDIENVFNDEQYSLNKHKRKSSILAESKIKKLIENQDTAEKEDKNVKTIFESKFCGISKVKRPLITAEGEDFVSNILKNTAELDNTKVLQDKTNSPRKEILIKKVINDDAPFNPMFFTKDPIIIEEDTKIQSTESLKIKNEPVSYSCSKNYQKLREINTKLNEGYKTVEIRRKAVIGLFNCTKVFFSKSKRKREVYFNLEAQVTKHNSEDCIKPIIIKSKNNKPSFEWTSEKQIVDVVQRIDLGSEISTEDFIFKKIDKKIES